MSQYFTHRNLSSQSFEIMAVNKEPLAVFINLEATFAE